MLRCLAELPEQGDLYDAGDPSGWSPEPMSYVDDTRELDGETVEIFQDVTVEAEMTRLCLPLANDHRDREGLEHDADVAYDDPDAMGEVVVDINGSGATYAELLMDVLHTAEVVSTMPELAASDLNAAYPVERPLVGEPELREEPGALASDLMPEVTLGDDTSAALALDSKNFSPVAAVSGATLAGAAGVGSMVDHSHGPYLPRGEADMAADPGHDDARRLPLPTPTVAVEPSTIAPTTRPVLGAADGEVHDGVRDDSHSDRVGSGEAAGSVTAGESQKKSFSHFRKRMIG